MFGKVAGGPQQRDDPPFYPRSPYGCAKLFAHMADGKLDRESYNLFACSGIPFYHESPRRAKSFVTRKNHAAAQRSKKTAKDLYLGNLDSERDWGYAKEYVEGMWLMLQQEKPDDYNPPDERNAHDPPFLDASFSRVN